MKKAIVIGASSGMGRELAKILSENGYVVGVMARRLHLLEELSNEINIKSFFQEIDVADARTAMETLANFITEMGGGADLIVISAGTGDINSDLNWQLENNTIRTNVIGFAALANVAIHHFIEKGSGHLVAISSMPPCEEGENLQLITLQRLSNPIIWKG